MQLSKNTVGRNMIILGIASISLAFLIYARYDYPSITPDAVPVLQRMAYGMYAILVLSFGAIGYGLYRYFKQKLQFPDSSTLYVISFALNSKRSKQIFAASALIYGVFFSFTSGILVFQPDVVFSEHYNVEVPSAHMTPCCGPPGYMPSAVAYFTEHFGMKIVPINLVLQVAVSFLVGLNFAMASNAFSSIKKSGGGLGGIGATTGLFIACPTCAGSFLTFLVGSGAGAFTITLTQMQTGFILVSIPVLLFTPWLVARTLRKYMQGGKTAKHDGDSQQSHAFSEIDRTKSKIKRSRFAGVIGSTNFSTIMAVLVVAVLFSFAIVFLYYASL